MNEDTIVEMIAFYGATYCTACNSANLWLEANREAKLIDTRAIENASSGCVVSLIVEIPRDFIPVKPAADQLSIVYGGNNARERH